MYFYFEFVEEYNSLSALTKLKKVILFDFKKLKQFICTKNLHELEVIVKGYECTLSQKKAKLWPISSSSKTKIR